MGFTLHHCKYSTKWTQSQFIIVQPSLNFAITLCKLSNEGKLGKQALSILIQYFLELPSDGKALIFFFMH